MLTKLCTYCGQSKPATRDYFGSTPSGGLRGKCRSCVNEASRAYEKDNKEGRSVRDQRRKDRAGGERKSFDLVTKIGLYRKQNGYCVCCFTKIASPEEGEVDHVRPLTRGGADLPSNLLLAHAQCNREKHGKTLAEHWEWRVRVGLDSENLGRKHGLLK
jgi:5-methylcytosine-specific restriction endonuclease McrA